MLLELQLEDRDLRQRALSATSLLLELCKEAQQSGLLKPGEWIDNSLEHLAGTLHRYHTLPTVGLVPTLYDHCETLERKLIIWKHLCKRATTDHQRARLAHARPLIMKLWSGDYTRIDVGEQLQRFHCKSFFPMHPYSGAEYAKEVGASGASAAAIDRIISRSYRLESRSERILRKESPNSADTVINGWWRRRHQLNISLESQLERKARQARLMQRYGISFPAISGTNHETHTSAQLASSLPDLSCASLAPSPRSVTIMGGASVQPGNRREASLNEHSDSTPSYRRNGHQGTSPNLLSVLNATSAAEQLALLAPLLEQRILWRRETEQMVLLGETALQKRSGVNSLTLIRHKHLKAQADRLVTLEKSMTSRCEFLRSLAEPGQSAVGSRQGRSLFIGNDSPNAAPQSASALADISPFHERILEEYRVWNSNYPHTVHELQSQLEKLRAESRIEAGGAAKSLTDVFEKIQRIEEHLGSIEERGSHLAQLVQFMQELVQEPGADSTPLPQSAGGGLSTQLASLPEQVDEEYAYIDGMWQLVLDTSSRKTNDFYAPYPSKVRPFPGQIQYTPTIEPGHFGIQETLDQLAQLSQFVKAFQGFEQIAQLHAKSISPDDLVSPSGKQQHKQSVASEQSTDLAFADMVSLSEGDLAISEGPDNTAIITLQLQLYPEACSIPTQMSVIEVSVPLESTSRQDMEARWHELRARYAEYRDVIQAIPLQHRFFQELTSMGEITRLENFALQGANDFGDGYLTLRLARGAILRNIQAHEPGTVLRVFGSSATLEGIDLSAAIVEISLTQADWKSCTADRLTVVRGSFGKSIFDQQCSLHFDATRADLTSIEVEGDALADRLSGLLFRAGKFPRRISQGLESREVSAAAWEEKQRLQSSFIGKWRFIKLVTALSDDIGHTPDDSTYDASLLARGTPNLSRYELRVGAPFPYAHLKLLVADSQDSEPCQLVLHKDSIDRRGSLGTHAANLWSGRRVHYHQALFEMIDFMELGTLTWPASRGAGIRRRDQQHSRGVEERTQVFEVHS
jgi:hypothetical protein